MSLNSLINNIETDVNDILKIDFSYIKTNNVPNSEDTILTFEPSTGKKGKELNSCVLYADIRDSVALTQKHNVQTMGKIYTAFTKSILKVANYHNGFVRNIIGDRVMIVFPEENCFTNAVHYAISINHIATKVINQKFNVDFKCGIGIDYGILRIIKVGIQKQGNERHTNKNLIWVGEPANIASRLTDVANKTIEEEYYEVVRHPFDFLKHFGGGLIDSLLGTKTDRSQQPDYLEKKETVEQSPERFADSISLLNNGELYYAGGKLVKFSKKVKSHSYPAILITESVYKGYKDALGRGAERRPAAPARRRA